MNNELPAITQQLAAMCADHNFRHTSLRAFCETARDNPGQFIPPGPDWTLDQQVDRYAGFMTAMEMVIVYIDSASPTPRAGVKRTHR